MRLRRHPLARALLAGGVALAVTLGVLLAAGAPPLTTLTVLAAGSFGSGAAVLRTLSNLTPLLLCGAGLCLTFSANLWNIGVEGQITLGAVCCLWLLRAWDPAGALPPALGLTLSLVAAGLGGAAWALLSGLLRVKGRVHEIFSGLGLNFVALGLSLWLILGAWKRPGMASLSGTEPLPEVLRLPTLAGSPMSPAGLLLALAAYGLVWWIARRTFFGLTLVAVRQNPTAAAGLGLAPDRRLLSAMALGGALAGLAGGLLVTGLYHRLVPSISGTFGYTAILAVLMASLDLRVMPLACLFFAALTVGSVQLPLQLSLDSSLAGVIQGVLVLTLLAVRRPWTAKGREVS
jgi:general nucleoside transport system permease protein